MGLLTEVRSFWEQRACGTNEEAVKDSEKYSKEWFERVEEENYFIETDPKMDPPVYSKNMGILGCAPGKQIGTYRLTYDSRPFLK